MKTQVGGTDLEHLGLMRKRVQYLIGARIRNQKKILEASHNIDKLQRKVSGLNSVDIIRKFRGEI
ncbi:MAG: hypothetical protein AUJ85_01825 [Elusimicrobia bacterium CG1_02_37_114]|nr:MAG: hypothetical protein AUJ85_01825 [Elusimicrobia bacterium CG1_02_37_114]PIV52889.1 MAG: hypothetical protein COS17_06775 [Elusimicrobia bacterium CG02_land_8_20_14_3_00_37_13]PIZ12504.1 MAG: hypothetical protein COY53_09660 [Elusimicrobia bacterium CG_4_10_14_0_8_um_filter_37_32]